MDDFLQSQILESCKLALPIGLKDLMHDISREVLRAQPTDILQFITKYLAALLVTREDLCVASRICGNVCDSTCHPELEEELKNIGLDEEGAVTVKNIVNEFFDAGAVNETKLLIKLAKKISINESQLLAVQEAVRKAFLRHQVNNTTIYEVSSDSDEYTHAAKHTLNLYKKTNPTDEEYHQAASRIQAAYRAYGVRRHLSKEIRPSTDQKSEKKCIHFEESQPTKDDTSSPFTNIRTVSSVSLAGSHLHLPKYQPYSCHDELGMIPEGKNYQHKHEFRHDRQESDEKELLVEDINIEDNSDTKNETLEELPKRSITNGNEKIVIFKENEDVNGDKVQTTVAEQFHNKSPENQDIPKLSLDNIAVIDDAIEADVVSETSIDEEIEVHIMTI